MWSLAVRGTRPSEAVEGPLDLVTRHRAKPGRRAGRIPTFSQPTLTACCIGSRALRRPYERELSGPQGTGRGGCPKASEGGSDHLSNWLTSNVTSVSAWLSHARAGREVQGTPICGGRSLENGLPGHARSPTSPITMAASGGASAARYSSAASRRPRTTSSGRLPGVLARDSAPLGCVDRPGLPIPRPVSGTRRPPHDRLPIVRRGQGR